MSFVGAVVGAATTSLINQDDKGHVKVHDDHILGGMTIGAVGFTGLGYMMMPDRPCE